MNLSRVLMIAGCILFVFNQANAVELDVQPRIETGVMSYSFEQSAYSQLTQVGADTTGNYMQTREEIEYSSTMGFAGGGLTFFVNRLFVDLSGKITFEGSDELSVSESLYNENDEAVSNLSTFTTVIAGYDADLERSDHAVSVGYAVTRRLSVYAGYKWVKVDTETTIDGPFSYLVIDNAIFNGRIMGHEDVEFEYEGPFIGVTHGWPIDGSSIFKGLISVNAGMAHLNSKLKRRRTLQLQVTSNNGEAVAPMDLPSESFLEEIKGDTLGLTLGLSWRGETWLENLTYSLGINGHRYQFDSDNSISPDISETALSFKVGLAYLF